jgi:hypothetical protein
VASYFAEETGGPVVQVRKGDYLSAMRILLDGISGAYFVGFNLSEEELDGKYHSLEISVRPASLKGKGKTRVSYRRGYGATK